MPSLGFLKKKRNREGTDTSQPSSPITPTSSNSKSFEPNSARTSNPTSAPAPAPAPTSQAHQSTASATSQQPAAAHQLGQQQQPDANAQQPPMHNAHLQHAYASPPMPTPSPGSEQQNLPRIANLINPPQNDGTSHSQSYHQQLGNQFPVPPANSGLVGHNQQYTSSTMPQPQHNYQQQQQQQPLSQQPQQQAVQPVAQGETRVTKGKYSLADFDILRTLGTGSFGRVHLVQSRHNQRFYAVKVLKKAQVVKMKQVEHTNDERKMLGEVKHPFLITLWGTFQDSRNLYMVMDFVEGGELFSLLRKSGVRRSPTVPSLWKRVRLTDMTAVPQPSGQVLCCRSNISPGIPALEEYNISGSEARKLVAGQTWTPENNRFRVRQTCAGQDMDTLRHTGLPGPGSSFQQGIQQVG